MKAITTAVTVAEQQVIVAINMDSKLATICCDTDISSGNALVDQLDQRYEIAISNKLCCDILPYNARILIIK